MATAATEPARVNERKAFATDYAARGWCVFPAPPGQKKGFKKAEDHGGRRWGHTTDPAQIAADWARWSHANIGIACGPESGLFVVEADTIQGHGVDGIANFAALVAEHGGLPDTIEQISPSGSHHYLFEYPAGVKIKNSESKVAKGVDVRGEGGMIIAAPSIKPGHPEPYRWIKPPGLYDLAPCPDWLLKLCIAEEKPKKGAGAIPRAVPSDSDDLVLSWLYTRPNDLSRDDWVRLCFALKGHFGERAKDGWLSFSSRYSGGVTDGEARRQWEAAEPSGRVDLGTAIYLLGGHERSAPSNRRAREAPAPDNDAIDPETGEILGESADDRRRRQRDENVAIGEGSDTIPTATVCTLDELLDRFVLIKDGSQVAPIDRPQSVLALADFKNAMAASKHWIEVEGKKKALPAVRCWLECPDRKEAEALTFRAGGARMTTEPGSGKAALNLWADITRPAAPADWRDRARLFTDHVEWLWGDDAGAFLDWLAHIEQRPGVLPHYGWVHISREHGKGRNWISSALARVWSGYVAASLDLIPILEGGFNGRISRKLLAIVDEINEGGSTSYRHAQKLRQIVTEEHRDINPKYGRQRVEYNACRWLMFSNHIGALPLTEDDRRFYIVAHDGPPKGGTYYARLYGALSDPSFITSVAEFLRRRDLTAFRPGERPPMNRAKAELVAFSQSDDDATLKLIARKWPVDLITGLEITNALGEGGATRAAVRHAMDRAGFRKLPRKVRVYEQDVQTIYALRRFEHWSKAVPDEQRAEIIRADAGAKRRSLEPDEGDDDEVREQAL